MAQIAVSVRSAPFAAGSANAVTPLLTASTPVIAVQPLANARISSQKLAAIAADGCGAGGTTGVGRPPASSVLLTPMTITDKSVMINRYVGTMNATPDSLTPRRLTTVIMARIARQSQSV